MIKILASVILIIISAVVFYNLGFDRGIGNQTLRYGESGLPKNCRALIAANIDGYASGAYTAEEIINSINRNCGADGYNWDER